MSWSKHRPWGSTRRAPWWESVRLWGAAHTYSLVAQDRGTDFEDHDADFESYSMQYFLDHGWYRIIYFLIAVACACGLLIFAAYSYTGGNYDKQPADRLDSRMLPSLAVDGYGQKNSEKQRVSSTESLMLPICLVHGVSFHNEVVMPLALALWELGWNVSIYASTTHAPWSSGLMAWNDIMSKPIGNGSSKAFALRPATDYKPSSCRGTILVTPERSSNEAESRCVPIVTR